MNARRTPARVLPAYEQIRSRTSRGTAGRSGLPLRIFHVQKIRNALRCQATTVSGFTITSPDRQSVQTRESQTHNSRSAAYNRGRFFTERSRTPIWCWSAMFSSCRAARVFRTDAAPARRIASQHDIGSSSARIRCNFHDLSESEFTRGSMRSFRTVAVGRKCGKFERGGNDRSRCRGLISSTQNEKVSLRL